MAVAAALLPWDVFEEHLEEASFLFKQREWALRAPDHSWVDVRDGEEQRLIAHIDGLVLGGAPVAERLLLPALAADEPGTVTAAALALLWSEAGSRFTAVAGSLIEAKPEMRAAIALAFVLAGRSESVEVLWPLLAHKDREVVAHVLPTLASLMVPLASVIRPLLGDPSPEVAIAALDALALAPMREQIDWIVYRLGRPEQALRDAAFRAGLSVGLMDALRAARHVVAARDPGAGAALVVLGLGATPADTSALAELARRHPELRKGALFALGYTGRVAAVDACVELCTDEVAAPFAAESIAAITGVHIAGPLAASAREKPSAPYIGDEDLDTPAAPGVEARLPVPAPDEVSRWWKGNRAKFDESRRYLRGAPMTPALLAREIAYGPARRAPALALEVLIRSRGLVHLPLHGWAGTRVAAVAGAVWQGLDMDAPLERFLT